MKLNPDCLRDTLIWLEENLTVSDNGCFSEITLHDLYGQIKDYINEEIYYSIYNLFKVGFIEGEFELRSHNMGVRSCKIINITYDGHQFLNTIRPDTIWQATKKGASKLGIMSINALSTISMEITKAVITNPTIIQNIINALK